METIKGPAARAVFTPGPWRSQKWDRIGGGHVFEIQALPGAGWGATICSLSSGIDKGNSDRVEPECEANARLISVAPDLYETVRKAATTFHDFADTLDLLHHEIAANAARIAERALLATLAKAEVPSAADPPSAISSLAGQEQDKEDDGAE